MKERTPKTQDLALSDAEFAKNPSDDNLSGCINEIHEENRFRSICSDTAYSLLAESKQERSIAELELSPPAGEIHHITRQLLDEYLREFAELEVEKLEDEVRGRIESEVGKISKLLKKSQSIAA
ncbi:MAG: hypothetical protein ABID64_00430 [Nitrospirota bacterium]